MLVNLLAFPGVGTVMAGRKIGFVQAAVMSAGSILAVVGLAFLYQAILGGSSGLDELRPGVGLSTGLMLGGFSLCIVAWVWALFSSMSFSKRLRLD